MDPTHSSPPLPLQTDDDHGFDDDRFFEEVDDFNHDIDIFGSADRDGEPMTKEALVEAGGEEVRDRPVIDAQHCTHLHTTHSRTRASSHLPRRHPPCATASVVTLCPPRRPSPALTSAAR